MPEPEEQRSARRRGRGDRAGLTLSGILEAARGLDPQRITVKAVADRLGVDRAAVHHHVSDLHGLRRLVAGDAVSLHLTPLTISDELGWREACRLLAQSIHGAVMATDGLAAYVHLENMGIGQLRPVEQTLRIMVAAGFDDESAARCLASLATLSTACARQRLQSRTQDGHPHVPAMRSALDEGAGSSALPTLDRLVRADLVSHDDRQLGASLDLMLDGMEALLTRLTSAGLRTSCVRPRSAS